MAKPQEDEAIGTIIVNGDGEIVEVRLPKCVVVDGMIVPWARETESVTEVTIEGLRHIEQEGAEREPD